jgi:hypothetical protein
MLGTGGLSHQLDGERAGFINKDFDLKFMDSLVGDDPRWATQFSGHELVEQTGTQGVELLMWMATRHNGRQGEGLPQLPHPHQQHRLRPDADGAGGLTLPLFLPLCSIAPDTTSSLCPSFGPALAGLFCSTRCAQSVRCAQVRQAAAKSRPGLRRPTPC